jgi:dienelactone hydrolase
MKKSLAYLVLVICLLLYGCTFAKEKPKESKSPEYEIKENKVKIGKYGVDGILTIPVSDEVCPVVVMVQGSGQSDYNAMPLADIATGLAKKGIASIRITKRFYQFPEFYNNSSTVNEEVLDDIYEAIDYVANVESVDKEKVYLLGHSFGAMLGPKIISEKDIICGFISMAGSPRKLEDIILDQNKAYLEVTVWNKQQRDKLLQEVVDIVAEIKNADPDSDKLLLDIPSKYWCSLNEIDYNALAKDMDVPVLILQGTDDIQIYADKDFPALKAIYGEKADSILYDGLDHLFMNKGDTHINEEVVKDIAEWIKK